MRRVVWSKASWIVRIDRSPFARSSSSTASRSGSRRSAGSARMARLRDRVQQALIYPAFLAVAGIVLITIFITFMVPQLSQFMSANGGALPLPTRILLEVHHLITGYWWLAILIGIGISVGFRAFVR